MKVMLRLMIFAVYVVAAVNADSCAARCEGEGKVMLGEIHGTSPFCMSECAKDCGEGVTCFTANKWDEDGLMWGGVPYKCLTGKKSCCCGDSN